MFGLTRFLPGLLITQAAAVLLVLFFLDHSQPWAWAQLVAILAVLSLVVAFWFDSMAKHLSKDAVADQHQKFARERERLRVHAEREKGKIAQQSQQNAAKEMARMNAKANLKVGASLTGAAGFGVLMVLTEFVTLGLMTLFTAGGAMGGYLFRSRQLGRDDRLVKMLNRTPKKS